MLHFNKQKLSSYHITLEKGSRKHLCPLCNRKSFVRYVDNRTGQLLPFEYGRCDREVKCQYSFNPYKTDYIKSIADQSNDTKWQRQEEFRKTPKQKGSESSISSSIPYSIMAKSRKGYENNHFIQFLIFKFGNDRTNKAIVDYHIGTSKHWQGATIFWQIDIEGIIRAGKILQYDSVTGKRSKNNVPPVFWVHSKLKLKNFVLSQCLFGSHLLSLEPYKPVGLVESEKTAVIASICFPKFIWLATGGKSNLNSKALQFLKGRKVIVFPDLGATKDWKNIITKLSLPFYISDQLEKNATEIEKQEGLDLADFLLMERDTFIKEWNLEDKALCIVNPTIESCTKNNLNELSAKSEFFRQIKQDEKDQIKSLTSFFDGFRIPFPIQLDKVTIVGGQKWVDSHLETITSNQNSDGYKPYLDRLLQLKDYLVSNYLNHDIDVPSKNGLK